jgi:hypothetical protein
MVMSSVRAIVVRPISWPLPAACTDPARISHFVPVTKVSYSTISPRKNGARAKRLRCRIELSGSDEATM